MAKRESKNIRVDPIFAKTMEDLAQIRLTNKLARFDPKELSPREMTRLLTKTDGFQKSIEELKTKPKKENVI